MVQTQPSTLAGGSRAKTSVSRSQSRWRHSSASPSTFCTSMRRTTRPRFSRRSPRSMPSSARASLSSSGSRTTPLGRLPTSGSSACATATCSPRFTRACTTASPAPSRTSSSPASAPTAFGSTRTTPSAAASSPVATPRQTTRRTVATQARRSGAKRTASGTGTRASLQRSSCSRQSARPLGSHSRPLRSAGWSTTRHSKPTTPSSSARPPLRIWKRTSTPSQAARCPRASSTRQQTLRPSPAPRGPSTSGEQLAKPC
eukprot:Amastigsp_a177219_105.p2 type:complete len:258 gc:universal Amastigsp_a177219_105:1316-543(-)